MKDHRKTSKELIQELASLRQRIEELERMEVESRGIIETLQSSESRHRFLMDHMEDIAFIVDLGMRVTYVSPSIEKVLGFTPDERMKQSPEEKLTFESFARAVELMTYELARDKEEGVDPNRSRMLELGYYHKDGSVKFLETCFRGDRDDHGNITRLFGLSRDVTERKQAEESLRASEQQMQAIINASPIPQFVIDKNHCIIHWNRALEEHSGIKKEDVIGTTHHWKAFYSHERPCLADLLVDDALDKIAEWYAGKYKCSRLMADAFEATDFFPDILGGTWLYFTAASIRDTDGTIIGAVETLADITERKRAEDALRKSEELYTKLIATIPDIVVQTDANGQIFFINEAGPKTGR